MIHAAILKGNVLPAGLVTMTARCWKAARRLGAPVQPTLHAALSQQDCGMLAPVFDSLLSFCEAALDRPIVTGEGGAQSDDERLIVGLLEGSMVCSDDLDCGEGAACALDYAVRSARIMLALTLGLSVERPTIQSAVA